METDLTITFIKAAFIALIMDTLGVYGGAVIIAFFASILKLFYYTNEYTTSCAPCNVFRNFIKFLGISLPLTLLMVHVCIYMNFDPQLSIIYSSIVAFLGKEILDIVVIEVPPVIKKVIIDRFSK